MTAASQTRASANRASDVWTGRPVLTAAVFGVTLAVSVAALVSPALMRLLIRDLPRLRTGQWWRVVTPVLVQPSGWGQLIFNLLGVAVLGAALQRRLGWASWSLIYLAGGSGSIAVYSTWHPADTGGGSSAAVAALIGAFVVVSIASGRLGALAWVAQLYSVFFAVYLTTLDLGGVVPSIIAGNASIIVMFAARRAVSPTALTRACLLVVLAAGVAMTASRDDHGAGIIIGVTLACLVLARRRVLEPPATAPRWRHLAIAVVGVVAATVLTWVAWSHLLGIALVVMGPGGRESRIGWFSVSVVAAAACVAAALALRSLQRRWPVRGIHFWTGLCLGVAVISVTGPLGLAVGTASLAGLLTLHVVCAAATVALLAPATEPRNARPSARPLGTASHAVPDGRRRI